MLIFGVVLTRIAHGQIPRDRLDGNKNRVETMAADGAISNADLEMILEWVDALDRDKARHKYFDKFGHETSHAPGTVARYLSCMIASIDRGCIPIEASAEEFNDFMDGQHDDAAISKRTLMVYQSGIKTFYRYYQDDLGVDPDDVHTYNETSTPKHDEQDMFTEEEVERLRDACRKPRDRAFLELLIFTGQRIKALLTLRIKDVDLEKGRIFLNADYDEQYGGLKGALRRGRKRPMFGARKYVRDWLQYHPYKHDRDHWLFIGDPENARSKPDEHWTDSGARGQLVRIAELAKVDKPVNPHNFRHYFVTVMKQDYNVDSDTLRMLLGLRKDSDIMDNTYSHVANDKYVQNAEETLGYREKTSTESPLTPDFCPTCGELLKSHWRKCPACNEVFAPELEDLVDALIGAREASLDDLIDDSTQFNDQERTVLRTVISSLSDPVPVADRLQELTD